jgi:phosphatidylserine/phosphatidylglycerophosphate/cardiolipin synthase-like enzyme
MPTNNASFSLPGFSVYFLSHRANINGEIPARLSSFIDGARDSLDCAIYDLKNQVVLHALKRAAARGISLRIGYDASREVTGGRQVDPKAGGTAASLQRAGLDKCAQPIHATGSHLMHDNFLVRDGEKVWTGSGKFTNGGLQLQDNNFLVVESADLALIYTRVFGDMLAPQHKSAHTGDTSGIASPVSGKTLKVGSVSITPYFATGRGEVENVETAVVAAMKGVKRIRLAAMLVSEPNILEALLPFKTIGNDIEGVLDPNEMKQVMSPSNSHSKLNPALFWFAEGDKRFVAAPSHAYHSGDSNDFMHNKLMILDDHRVITGSYNFSENAESNDENLLVVESRQVAAAYTRYFDALFKQYSKNGAKLPPA